MKNVFTGILAKGYAVCRQEHGVHVSTTPSIRGCQGAHCVPQTSYADVLTLSTSAVVVVESLSHVRLFVTPWTATCQASLSFTIFWSLLKLMSIELKMPSNHLILYRHLLCLPSIFPKSILVKLLHLFSNGRYLICKAFLILQISRNTNTVNLSISSYGN